MNRLDSSPLLSLESSLSFGLLTLWTASSSASMNIKPYSYSQSLKTRIPTQSSSRRQSPSMVFGFSTSATLLLCMVPLLLMSYSFLHIYKVVDHLEHPPLWIWLDLHGLCFWQESHFLDTHVLCPRLSLVSDPILEVLDPPPSHSLVLLASSPLLAISFFLVASSSSWCISQSHLNNILVMVDWTIPSPSMSPCSSLVTTPPWLAFSVFSASLLVLPSSVPPPEYTLF